MTAQPHWSPVEDETADLLALVAMGSPSTGSAEEEWEEFVAALRFVAEPRGGEVNPNNVRELVRDVVAPRRISAFYNRALRSGLLSWRGEWAVSTDSQGGNAGRPVRIYWLGAA